MGHDGVSLTKTVENTKGTVNWYRNMIVARHRRLFHPETPMRAANTLNEAKKQTDSIARASADKFSEFLSSSRWYPEQNPKFRKVVPLHCEHEDDGPPNYQMCIWSVAS